MILQKERKEKTMMKTLTLNKVCPDNLDSSFKTALAYSACQSAGNDPMESSSKYAEKIRDISLEMLSYYVLPLVGEEAVAIYDEEKTIEAKEITKSQARIFAYLIASQDYYGTLAELYKGKSDDLMKQIMAKYGTAEMPQTATMESIQESQDNDLSRVRIQLQDGGTTMQRLAEIQENYRSVMQDWKDEFIKRFILYN